jgi:hypothetical protein
MVKDLRREEDLNLLNGINRVGLQGQFGGWRRVGDKVHRDVRINRLRWSSRTGQARHYVSCMVCRPRAVLDLECEFEQAQTPLS